MNRRGFLQSSSATVLGLMLPEVQGIAHGVETHPSDGFEWSTPSLRFSYSLSDGRLRQHCLVPAGFSIDTRTAGPAGVEVALQCTGQNSPDPGMKQAMGQSGVRLQFAGKHEDKLPNGQLLTILHNDSALSLEVGSVYQSFTGSALVRRHTRITNNGNAPVGIDFVSSAMLQGLADPQRFDGELRIHLAVNSWMAEGQWHTFRPSELGFVENERTSWSEASAFSVGSWSTEKYLPMAVVENARLGLVWFWQIEHDGSWYWEISNVSERGNHAEDVYAYLGGRDAMHDDAWKNLQPG
jgi:alpha-galactosidase